MKTIAVFFEREGAFDYPFDKRVYFNAHRELGAEIERQGGAYRIVRHRSSYCGGGRFSRSWRFDGDAILDNGPLQADVIYDKGYFEPDAFRPVFNCPEVNEICTNKWRTYELFPQWLPETVLVEGEDAYRGALSRIAGSLKVVKPIDGLQGEGVEIASEAHLLKHPPAFPALVQEFLDTRCGVPGIADGVHDFRITLLSGKLVFAYVRTPPPGQLVAALARGASFRVIDPADIPGPLLDLAMAADSELAPFGPRLISVDMAYTPCGPRLIELNSRVGLQENASHRVFAELKRGLAQVLLSL